MGTNNGIPIWTNKLKFRTKWEYSEGVFKIGRNKYIGCHYQTCQKNMKSKEEILNDNEELKRLNEEWKMSFNSLIDTHRHLKSKADELYEALKIATEEIMDKCYYNEKYKQAKQALENYKK